MMKSFKQIDPAEVSENFIRAIGHDWMLITAGDATTCNTMTASWGFVGEMWGKHAAMVVIRPTRYTKEFVDAQSTLTLNFLGEEHRKALQYCGTHSGREGDKIAASGLSATTTDVGTPAIAEARLVLECRKLYVDEYREEAFLQPELAQKWYPLRDYHVFYILEIVHAYVK